MLYKTYLYKFNVAYRYKKIGTVNFSMICLSTGFTVVLEHHYSCDGLLQWNQSWKGTYIERPPVYKDHLKIFCISSLYLQSAYMYFCGLCCLKKDVISHSDINKGVAKKVQVTERLKGVKSLWGQEEKICQQRCVELQHTKQVN